MNLLARAAVRRVGALICFVLWTLLGSAPVANASVSRDGPSPVVVEVDRQSADAGPGQRISFTSTVTNTGGATLSGLVAHLSILSSDPDVYVDPEDWSASRTQYLDELAAGESAQFGWSIQAVTGGPLILYVSVTDQTLQTTAVSSPIDVKVGGQRVVDSGGVFPLVLGIPAVVVILLAAALARRTRHR